MSEANKELGFNLSLPFVVPTEEEIETVKNSPKEEFIQHLLDTEYLTVEELTAYYSFMTMVTGLTPYLLDGFLDNYRHAKSQ